MTTELKAGRELDALVAQHVFGFTQIVDDYSTSIADAWEVVEHMRQESANLSSDVWTRWTNALAVKFQFSTHKLMLEITPEDICLAALEAVGYSVPLSSTAASAPSGS